MRQIILTALFILSFFSVQAQYLVDRGPTAQDIGRVPVYQDHLPRLKANTVFSWKRELRSAVIPAALSVAGGGMWGLHEAIQWRKASFRDRFPGADPQYWDNTYSWENKYWRKNCPVQLSDAYHMTTTVHNFLLFSSGVAATIPIARRHQRGRLWHTLARVGIQSLSISAGYTVGNWMIFDKLFAR